MKSGLFLGAALVLSAAAPAAPPAASDSLEVDAYPAKSRELKEEGTVHYRVEVNSKGQLESCQVTRSSGFERLDEATCKLMVRAARFDVRKDQNGRGKSYAHEGAVVWKL